MNLLDIDESEIAVNFEAFTNFRTQQHQHQEVEEPKPQTLDPYVASENSSNEAKKFLKGLKTALKTKDVQTLRYLYFNEYNRLNEQYFNKEKKPWPAVEEMNESTPEDKFAEALYNELRFRQVFVSLKPTIEQHLESWDNYGHLLQLIAEASDDLKFPLDWLWDIMDEFVYQYESFCRSKVNALNSLEPNHPEIELLRVSVDCWHLGKVMELLNYFITGARVIKIDNKTNQEYLDVNSEDDSLSTKLSYFSLVCKLRIYVSLADYQSALKVINLIKKDSLKVFSRVAACYVTLFNYSGFALLMTKRTVDAIRTFTHILIYISRTKQYYSKSYQFDDILKKNDRMARLLALSLSLCPQQVDSSIEALFNELKINDQYEKMLEGNMAVFEEVLSRTSPKFINPILDEEFEQQTFLTHQEFFKKQVKLFLSEIEEQKKLQSLRGFLKLYKQLSIQKLAKLLKLSNEETINLLLSFKNRTRQLVSQNGLGVLDTAKWESFTEPEFYISGDSITVTGTKTTTSYNNDFLKNIERFTELIQKIKNK